MRVTRRGLTIHTYFESWSEFVNESKTFVDVPGGSSSRDHRAWSGTPTFEDAIELAERGWVEGAALIKGSMDVLTENLPRRTTAKELVWARTGPGFLNRTRYQAGRPRPFQVWQATEDVTDGVNGQVVKVVYNGSVSGTVDHETIKAKGILTCALLDALEHLGYRTELVVAFCTEVGRKTNTVEVMVKHASDWLDLDKIAFACAHPSSLRRLCFSIWEQMPSDIVKHYRIGNGYGHPAKVPELQDGTVYIPELNSGQAKTPEAQRQLIRETLAQVGVTFDEE